MTPTINIVTIVVAVGAAAARVAKTGSMKTVTPLPIVFMLGTDPVADRFVESLSRPGGNVTGATVLNVELAPKRLQVLAELLPEAKAVGALLNPADPQLVPQPPGQGSMLTSGF